MKKTLLGVSIISVFGAFASQYNALVTKEHSNYKSTDKYELIEYSNWVDIGALHTCQNFTPLDSEVYKDTLFNQEQECLQKQERNVSVYEVSSLDGTKTLINSYTENQDINKNQTVQAIGTYLAESCLDIIDHFGDNGDGKYSIFLPSGEETVYCDMNNGGWTMLVSSGSDIGRPNMTSLNLNKNTPPSSIDYNEYNYYPVMNDFFSILDTNTIFRFSCKDYTDNSIVNYYHKNINNFNTYFNLNQGSYTGTITCASDEDFTQNVSTTLHCIGGNDIAHRYYRSSLHEYGWAHYDGGQFPKMLRHCGAGWYGDDTPNHNGYIWFK